MSLLLFIFFWRVVYENGSSDVGFVIRVVSYVVVVFIVYRLRGRVWSGACCE